MLTIECYLLEKFHQLALPGDFLERLAPEQQLRATSLSGKRLHEFYFGRQLLIYAFEQFNTPNITSACRIIERDNNAPQLKNNTQQTLSSSITHSSDWLGIIVCDEVNKTKVGIDIETIRDNWSIEKAQLFCSQPQIDEALTIQDKHLRNRYFTSIWTQKEAVFKAGGDHVFNKDSELNGKSFLNTQILGHNSVMSIFCCEKAAINITQVSFIDNRFVVNE